MMHSTETHLDKLTADATAAASKGFRKLSVAIHPDRHGEHMRTRFEALCRAAAVLRNPNLRLKYLQEMVPIAAYYESDRATLQANHEVWMTQNLAAIERDEGAEHATTREAQKATQAEIAQLEQSRTAKAGSEHANAAEANREANRMRREAAAARLRERRERDDAAARGSAHARDRGARAQKRRGGSTCPAARAAAATRARSSSACARRCSTGSSASSSSRRAPTSSATRSRRARSTRRTASSAGSRSSARTSRARASKRTCPATGGGSCAGGRSA